MATAPATPTLAQAIRTKYPGVYDDLDDPTLESKIVAKYPQYSDMPRSAAPAMDSTPAGSIGAAPTGAGTWLNNAESDVRYGGTSTLLGKMLHGLGAQGINRGVSEGAADQIAGPLVGPVKAVQGVAEMGQHPFMGAIHALGGALQTASPAMAFMAPEAGEAAAAVPGKIAGMIPSAERAGKAFQQVMGAAKDVPMPVTDNLSQALSRYKELVDAGGSRSMSVSKLMNRINAPDKPPLTYKEARDFYSNITRLSADEGMRLTPVMKQQVGAVRSSLNDAITQTAGQVGKADQYSGAMNQYRKAMNMQDFTDFLKGQAGQMLLRGAQGVGAGAAAGAGYEGYKKLTGK